MAKKSDEIHAILKVFDETQLDKPTLIKNRSRYKEAKEAILTISDIIWDCDENAKINVVEEMGTAISLQVKCSVIATADVERLGDSIAKATRVEIFPAAGGIGACIIFDGVFIKQGEY